MSSTDRDLDDHVDENTIVMLALDEPTPIGYAGDAEHVMGCAICREIYDDYQHTVQVVRASRDVMPWEAPSSGVFDAIMAQVRTEPSAETASAPATPGTPATPPATASPTPAGGAPAADLATVLPMRAERHRPRPGAGWLVGVAAAGLIIGWAVGQSSSAPPSPPVAIPTASPSATAVARVGLDTLDTQEPRGDAEVQRKGEQTSLVVSAADLDGGDGFLEVWLINRDLTRMVSIGVLEGSSASFPISQQLLDEGYVIVDISREQFDDKATHSGDSVVRGTLSV